MRSLAKSTNLLRKPWVKSVTATELPERQPGSFPSLLEEVAKSLLHDSDRCSIIQQFVIVASIVIFCNEFTFFQKKTAIWIGNEKYF